MTQPFEKLKRDGKVAVLYSPGYGAGWYTWNSELRGARGLLFDREIAEAVLADDKDAAMAVAKKKYPGVYIIGGVRLEVEWVHEGARFDVNEDAGNEWVTILGPDFDHTA